MGPKGRIDARHLRRAIRQIGLLQIDYVNVLVPAQYQVPFSRLGPYDRSHLGDLVYRKRELTEAWAHEASIVPVEDWPLLRAVNGADRRARALATFLGQHAEYAERVLDEIRARGPLTADDLPDPDAKPRKRDFWGWTVPKTALEAQFVAGRLAVADRRADLARVFDLAERVIPAPHHSRRVTGEEAQRELLRTAARAHGVGTAAHLADYYRMPVREARARIAELVEEGELGEVRVEGWREAAYLHRDAPSLKPMEASTLLSPFDPVVWSRARTARLFDFDYRLEIWVPRAKRRWGYYVLPFLLGERLVGRVDLKADRKGRRLVVVAAYHETQADAGAVADGLAAELQAWAAWLGLESVAVGRRGNLARSLKAALRA